MVGLAATSLILGGCTSGGGKHGTGSDAAAAAPPTASIQVIPGESETINPVKPVVVKATHGKLTLVTMANPKKGTKVKGKLSGDGLTWTSAEPLAYNTAYQLTADVKGEQGHRDAEKKTTVTTLKPANLTYPSLIPPPSITDVGVGQP
ncbi:MAG: Ig-like domain-containing protein, partial [Sciscionella sp.]